MTQPGVNAERLIRLPVVDSKTNYLTGFWQWVEYLADDDYRGALESLYWPDGSFFTPETLKNRITTFFGGRTFFGRRLPWSAVMPNDRLIGVINDAAEYQPRNEEGWGWFMAQIPLTTEPAKAKDDDLLLMGLASSFFVRQLADNYVLEFEIFHV